MIPTINGLAKTFHFWKKKKDVYINTSDALLFEKVTGVIVTSLRNIDH